MPDDDVILKSLQQRFGVDAFQQQQTVDSILTLWLPQDKVIPVIQHLKSSVEQSYTLLYDLFGIDERDRFGKEKVPAKDFTVVYCLFSFERNAFIRLKVALEGEYPSMPSITSLFKNAKIIISTKKTL